MTLQNSYIFLENPFKKNPPKNNDSTNDTIVLVLPNSVHTYLKRAFPNIKETQNYHFHKKQYYLLKNYDKYTCKVQFTITNVVDTEYLDMLVCRRTCRKYRNTTISQKDGKVQRILKCY